MRSYFITGGTSGIGLALAALLYKRGDRVGICGRNLEKLPPDFLSSVNSDSNRFRAFTADVADEKKMKEVIEEFSKDGLDVVIANAGRSHGSKTQIPSLDVTKDIFKINLIGVVNTFFPAIDFFVKRKRGHIVAISSVAGMIGLPGASAYSASKAAVIKLCESYSLDLPKFGIDVTTICPGFIDTPLTQKNRHPMPFLISSEEAAIKIVDAIDKRRSVYIFPWKMAFVIMILEKMPRFLYRKIMKIKFINYSK